MTPPAPGRRRRFQDLPLLWKLLLPFLSLMLSLGVAGTFVIVRDLASREQAALDQRLGARSLQVRSSLRDRELYLLESSTFAANIQGMARAVRDGDGTSAERLLRSVVALKPELDLVVVTDAAGAPVVELSRRGRERLERSDLGGWGSLATVRRALTADARGKAGGIELTEAGRLFLIAAPVCAEGSGCVPLGAAVVGLRAELLASTVSSAADATTQTGVSIFDAGGARRSSFGRFASSVMPPAIRGESLERRFERIHGEEVATVYAPFEIQGRPAGWFAVSRPTAPALAPVRSAAIRLALTLMMAMTGVVTLGWLLARTIVRQVRALVVTNRAIGEGDFSARAPAASLDELGELARGVNQMAEQLQESYETLEMRVAERTDEIHRLLIERTEFFAAMSHEFRTPLAIIRSQSELILDPTYRKDEAWARATGRIVRDAADQLLAVINEILDLSRAEAGATEVDIASVHVRDVVKELRPLMTGLAKGQDLRMTVRLPRDLPAVRADPRRLREVLMNLVDNAVKYTPPGGRVSLTARSQNGAVELLVSDTGIGIPPEARDRIFEPFYRVRGSKPLNEAPSTGLGLAIAKRIVEAQGGSIRVEDSPEGGTTFRTTLPRASSKRSRVRP